MSKRARTAGKPSPTGVIELRIRDLRQLFNSLDPTPFPDRDLDADAEEFILGWAMEHATHQPLLLRIHLAEPVDAGQTVQVGETVRRYFAYRAAVMQRQFRQLLKYGRDSLIVGLVCLTVSVGGAHLVGQVGEGPLVAIVRESLIIGGWVAMWRPLQIFLYEWWPLRRSRRLCGRLARAQVELVPCRT